jgi:hypothetical protein
MAVNTRRRQCSQGRGQEAISIQVKSSVVLRLGPSATKGRRVEFRAVKKAKKKKAAKSLKVSGAKNNAAVPFQPC